MRLFLNIWFLFCSALFAGPNLEVKDVLAKIPKEDQQELEQFFRLLFRRGDFSYTFLGIKPACTIDYTMSAARKRPRSAFANEIHAARKGVDIWKQYEHLFPMQKLRLIIKDSDDIGEHFGILAINSEQMLPLLNAHAEWFTSAQQSLPNAINKLKEGTFFKESEEEVLLWGAILGYPKQDVLTFTTRFLPIQQEEIPLKRYPLSAHRNSITPVSTPFFMIDQIRDEHKELRQLYGEKKADIVTMYYREDFLTMILNRLLE